MKKEQPAVLNNDAGQAKDTSHEVHARNASPPHGGQAGGRRAKPSASIPSPSERRRAAKQDPFDFAFQLVMSEDMQHLLAMQDRRPVDSMQGADMVQQPGSSWGIEEAPQEEQLTAHIELLRQQCEDGLGMDMFQSAYSSLRDQKTHHGGDISILRNQEVVEFLADLQMLIRCEDIVYGV